jgi:hypothetical protein
MSHEEIGRMIKAKYPGAYNDVSDDELGRAYAEEYGLDEITPRRFKPGRQIFAKFGAAREGYQTAALKSQLDQEDIAAHGLDRLDMHFDKEVHEHEFLKDTQNLQLETQQTSTQLFKTVAQEAQAQKLPMEAYTAKVQLKATEEIRLASRNTEVDQDVRRADRMATVKIREEAEMAKIAVMAALTEKLFDKRLVQQFQVHIFQQVDQIERLLRLPESEGRTAKLQIAKTILSGWMEQLNELTGQGHVSGQNRKGLGGLEAPAKPSSDITEDD